MFFLIIIGVWVLALAAWWIYSSVFRTADVDKIKARLLGTSRQKNKKSSQQAPSLINQDTVTPSLVSRLIGRLNLEKRLQELVEQAGMRTTATRLAQGCLVAAAAGFLLVWFLLPPRFHAFAALGALVCGVVPVLWVVRKKNARLRKFEEQFPESLEFVARSMRAGHAFSVSLEMIHREFQEPLAGEFRRTFEEHNLGLPLDVALQKFAKRVPSLDVHFFVSAVLLQKRTGGNLAEILDKLAYVIRERFKLRGKIRAISAHGRMTGGALTSIPIAVAVLMFYTNPDYVKFFFNDDIGNIMLGAAVTLQLIGYGVIRKIVNIEV